MPCCGMLPIARRVSVKSGLLTDNGPPLADDFIEQLPDVAAVVPTGVFSGGPHAARVECPEGIAGEPGVLESRSSAVAIRGPVYIKTA